VKGGLQYMQDGKVSPMHVYLVIGQIRIDVDRHPAGQRTEANVSNFGHTCGLSAGQIFGAIVYKKLAGSTDCRQ
jgi:hypothetical protein